MRYARLLMVVTVGVGLAVGGCGSGGGGTVAGTPAQTTSAAAVSSSVAQSASVATAAAPTGQLSTTLVECATLKVPAGLKRANVNPVDGPMCAYDSDTDYVSFTVGTRLATSFKAAKVVEQANTNGKIVIEPVSADGWTFGARWPDNGPTARVQYWLVDGKNRVLMCKMGSDRGAAGIDELAAVCEMAKAALYTP